MAPLITRRRFIGQLSGGVASTAFASAVWADTARPAAPQNLRLASPVSTLLLNGFDAPFDSGLWTPYEPIVLARSTGEVPSVTGASVGKSSAATHIGINPPYDMYFYRVQKGPRSSYLHTRQPNWDPDPAIFEDPEVRSWQKNTYNCLSFWIRSPSSCTEPLNLWGDAYQPYRSTFFSFGTYTLAPSNYHTFGFNNPEEGGWHGYHSLVMPYTNGRWMKVQLYRPAGTRNSSGYPGAFRAQAAEIRGAFQPGEIIEATTSRAQVKFFNTRNITFGGKTYAFLYGYRWSEVQSSAVETWVGKSSGTSAVLSDAAYHFGSHTSPAGWNGEYIGEGAVGSWCNFDDSWITRAGSTVDGYREWGAVTHWDRTTRVYFGVVSDVGPYSAPRIYYLDEIMLSGDLRPIDTAMIPNIGGFYDPALEKLYVCWENNRESGDAAVEIRYAFADIHDLGWDNAVFWNASAIISGHGISGLLSCYQPLQKVKLAARPIWVGVRYAGRESFVQLGPLATA